MIKLDKYDKFYRMAGHPLINIHIHDFIDDIDEMGDKIKWEKSSKFQTE
jgi:hypothetical protein